MASVKRVAARQLSFRDAKGVKQVVKPDAPVTVEGLASLGGISPEKASDLLGDLIDDGAVLEMLPEEGAVDDDEEAAAEKEAAEAAAKKEAGRNKPASK